MTWKHRLMDARKVSLRLRHSLDGLETQSEMFQSHFLFVLSPSRRIQEKGSSGVVVGGGADDVEGKKRITSNWKKSAFGKGFMGRREMSTEEKMF